MNTTVNTRSEESKWKDRTLSPEDRIASSETVSELQDNTMGGNGENYHGEWF